MVRRHREGDAQDLPFERSGQYGHPGRQLLHVQLAQDREPVLGRHLQIEHQDVRPLPAHGRERRLALPALGQGMG